jgi:hypothetical protein
MIRSGRAPRVLRRAAVGLALALAVLVVPEAAAFAADGVHFTTLPTVATPTGGVLGDSVAYVADWSYDASWPVPSRHIVCQDGTTSDPGLGSVGPYAPDGVTNGDNTCYGVGFASISLVDETGAVLETWTNTVPYVPAVVPPTPVEPFGVSGAEIGAGFTAALMFGVMVGVALRVVSDIGT